MQGLIDLSGHQCAQQCAQQCAHTQVHPGRERRTVIQLQWGQVGSVSVQMGAASMLDKDWHPCWLIEASMLDLEESSVVYNGGAAWEEASLSPASQG